MNEKLILIPNDEQLLLKVRTLIEGFHQLQIEILENKPELKMCLVRGWNNLTQKTKNIILDDLIELNVQFLVQRS